MRAKIGVALAGVISLALCVGFTCVKKASQEDTAPPAQEAPPVIEATPPAQNVPPEMETAPQDQVVPLETEMVLVPAGLFIMGMSADDAVKECQKFFGACEKEQFINAEPEHKVYLDVYYIDKYEVTNEEYDRCSTIGKCRSREIYDNCIGPGQPEKWKWNDWECPHCCPRDGFSDPHQPVVGVTWEDAQSYCTWAGKRLPTEAEWEKAARGTDSRMYPWGNKFDGKKANFCDSKNCAFRWAQEEGDGFAETAPVGSYPAGASPCGAMDMAGNVSEWTADWYGEDYYKKSPNRNPKGPTTGEYRVVREDFHVDGEGVVMKGPTTDEYRVVRGGSWDSHPRHLLASHRFTDQPALGNLHLGFRCVRQVNPPETETIPQAQGIQPELKKEPTGQIDPPEMQITPRNQGVPLETEMVLIPAEEFMMGMSADDALKECEKYSFQCAREWFIDEEPPHKIYLDAYYIDRLEVTQEEYDQCVAAGTCKDNEKYDGLNGPRQPVVGVSWEDARTYCSWAGKRLPTEAEWEKAARGTEGRIYPWGNEFDGTRANFCDQNCEGGLPDWDDGYGRTAPVGSYPAGASPYGAMDMAGNVYEWTADWYGEDYYQTDPNRNPKGPASGEYRVVRGGSWYNSPIALPIPDREFHDPADRTAGLGIRCARD